jgi:methionine sulfoxide reductase catalytic subunit
MENKLNPIKPASSEITPESIYFSRRDFLKAMGFVSAGALLAACGPRNSAPISTSSVENESASTEVQLIDEFGDPANSFQDITNYNNYYEFSTNKQVVARLSSEFKARPWTIEVRGLVNKPGIFDIDDLLRIEQKERVYRMRCVEAWSMVIPWKGFELGDLLKKVEPQTSAKFVAFTTLFNEDQFPSQGNNFYPWPYTEGLRLDEAMHRLTILATGLYGKDLPNQNGAPLRLVVPWKYGFKSIKAITKISLVENKPPTMWNTIAPLEYGFYSNVNPNVDHPRWSQTSERRIGEYSRRETMMFNGYESEVASLYSNMDLSLNY